MVDIAGIGSLLQAGSSLFGGMLGASGQAAANAQQQAQYQQGFAEQVRQYYDSKQFSSDQMTRAEDFSNKQMKWAMDNNAYMAGTAYQRAMIDMKAAGLNPILAYQQGGANTPTMSGGSVSPTTVSPGNPGSGSPYGNAMAPLAAGINSAGKAAETYAALRNVSTLSDKTEQDTKKSAAETDQVSAQTDLTKSQDKVAQATKVLTEVNQTKARQETATSAAQAAAAVSAAANNNQDTANKAVQNQILKAQAVSAKAKSENDVGVGGGFVGDTMGSLARVTDTIGKAANRDVIQPVSDFFSSLYHKWKGQP